MPRTSLHRVLLAASLLGAALLLGLGAVLEPDERGHSTHEQLGLAPCGVYARWGVPCPACGLTTSVSLVAHGRVVEAAVVQPFGLLLGIGAPLVALWAVAMHVRGRDLGEALFGPRGTRALAVIVAAFFLAWGWKLVQTSSSGASVSSSSAVSGSTSSNSSR